MNSGHERERRRTVFDKVVWQTVVAVVMTTAVLKVNAVVCV